MKVAILFACLLSSHLAFADTTLREITPQKFIDEYPSPERKDIVHFIEHQFDDWRSRGVTQAQINEVWDNNKLRRDLLLARFQIIDQKLYADCYNIKRPYFRELLRYLQNLLLTHKIKDVDFIFNVVDIIELPTPNIPSFIMSKNLNSSYEKDRFILPDEFLLADKWGLLTAAIEKANVENPWASKENKIFWRGGLSGNELTIDNADKLPRLSIGILSKLYPDLIDAKFTTRGTPQNKGGHEITEVLDVLFADARYTAEADHLRYKYLASIDGWTCAWKRVPWIMLSNSVLLKQESSFIEWFYPAMKPYVHYVPMDNRLTNIFQQLEWMQTHDNEVQQISKNATAFIQNDLMPKHIKDHMAIILNGYHELHNGEKLIPTLPPAEETAIKASEDVAKGETLSRKLVRKFREFKYELKKKLLW